MIPNPAESKDSQAKHSAEGNRIDVGGFFHGPDQGESHSVS